MIYLRYVTWLWMLALLVLMSQAGSFIQLLTFAIRFLYTASGCIPASFRKYSASHLCMIERQ